MGQQIYKQTVKMAQHTHKHTSHLVNLPEGSKNSFFVEDLSSVTYESEKKLK